MTLLSCEVWASDCSDEQRISRDDKPRLITAPKVAHEQTNTVGRVARGVEDICQYVASFKSLTVSQRLEPKRDSPLVALVEGVQRNRRSRTGLRFLLGAEGRTWEFLLLAFDG